uniref:HECT domain-containing protein n=1 Tax=Rhodosorus marinus TaxID=101924 RepID=A0A7S2ZHD4_9RHOD|mmetsp:Transcript_18398/g.73796  ORF Transcript_18398/g.73796 Transcript_18398/m.73796 type:complete len:1061 (+) Transcript_18398:306-3488(+)|eukprot:CAMPEP_0113959708 /NCGR_PEP_ID=MMETSP0011_2-20120614/4300_1 /TAXON_ID=101924 /ORGANISM="Rhodosorus marinus" /LENGTH=1060 /DNA_ID=CAMNT_0000971061 /DNA_START=207 /DNA_END=3389 /DNA_ORIENTATION=- /assembly_acc=CAM_ASM_000156
MTADGDRVMAWGSCESGQLGACGEEEEVVSSPRHVPGFGSDLAVLTCGPWGTVSVGNSPNEVCTSGERGKPVATVSGLESTARVVDAGRGEDFLVVLTEDSKILTLGGSAYGQLGRGDNVVESTSLRSVKWPRSSRDIVKIRAGAYHWLAMSSTGKVFGSGSNSKGQLGIPDRRSISEPERIYNLWAFPVVDIATGANHSAVLTAHGHIYTFGSNRYGQLGVKSVGEQSNDAGGETSVTSPGGSIQLKDFSEYPHRVPCPDGLHYKAVACGADHTLAIRSDGRVVTFGKGTSGQLGCGSTGSSFSPMVVRLPSDEVFVSVVGGGRHSACLSLAGNLYTWGAGESGQLGNMDVADKLYPVKVEKPKRGRKRLRAPASMEPGGCGISPSEYQPADEIGGSQEECFWTMVACGANHTVAALSNSLDRIEAMKENMESRANTIATVSGSQAFGCAGYLSKEFIRYGASELELDAERAAAEYSKFLDEFDGNGPQALEEAALYLAVDSKDAFARGWDGSGQLVSVSSVANQIEPAMVLLLAMLNPSLTSENGLRYLGFLVEMAKYLRIRGKRSFIHTVSNDIPTNMLITRLITPIQMLIDMELRTERAITETVINSVKTLYLLFCAVKARGPGHEPISLKEFYNSTITQEVNLSRDYERKFLLEGEKSFSFCSYPFILDQEAKGILLRKEMKSVQHKCAMDSLMSANRMMSPNCEIEVRRDHLIQDSLSELLRRHQFPMELRKPLKVRFVGEAGEDAGGLRKEFFQIAIEKLFSPDFGMFTYDEENRYHWFRCDSLETNDAFNLVGTLVGLAIYNDTILDLHFPPVVYKKLQDLAPNFADLKVMSPRVAQSLQAVLDYDGDDMEDVLCVTFTVPYESIYGERVEHELVEGGKDRFVTQQNKHEFVRLYTEWVLEKSVEKAFSAFKGGMRRMIPGHMLNLFEPEEFEVLVCGEKFDDVGQLEKHTRYDGGYTQNSEVITWFWEVLNGLSPDRKRRFLAFVTGTDRVPAGGVEKLNFVIQRSGPDSDRLPTSHTCFNVLLLPDYSSLEKTKNRLLLSIENSQGFGLR